MRLIDADALIADIRKNSSSYFADDFAHEWVNKQPTVEPSAGWIPVEERLPKESSLYLVTRTDIIDDYAVDMRFFNREKSFVGWSGCEWHEDPLAWMELPKPYIPKEK